MTETRVLSGVPPMSEMASSLLEGSEVVLEGHGGPWRVVIEHFYRPRQVAYFHGRTGENGFVSGYLDFERGTGGITIEG